MNSPPSESADSPCSRRGDPSERLPDMEESEWISAVSSLVGGIGGSPEDEVSKMWEPLDAVELCKSEELCTEGFAEIFGVTLVLRLEMRPLTDLKHTDKIFQVLTTLRVIISTCAKS